MPFASVDPKLNILILGGHPVSGYADGVFIEIDFVEEQWRTVTGADGLTQRTKTNNYSGTITTTLMSSSLSNDILSSFWTFDRFGNAGVISATMKDASGRTTWTAPNAWVSKMPTQGFSKGQETRTWVIACDELTGIAGGNF